MKILVVDDVVIYVSVIIILVTRKGGFGEIGRRRANEQARS